MPLAEIALQAGFGSIRSFNAAFLKLYGREPSSLRRTPGQQGGRLRISARLTTITPPRLPDFVCTAVCTGVLHWKAEQSPTAIPAKNPLRSAR